MDVALTGATGVIGRRVISLLEGQGHRVTVLLRKGSTRTALLPPQCKVVEASLFDRDALAFAFEGQEAVINLATRIPQSALQMIFPWGWRQNDRIRTTGAQNVALAASRAGVRILIQESFGLAYPPEGEAWIEETVSLRPNANCRTVVAAEAAVAGFANRGGRGIALRFAAFYGPDASQTRTIARAAQKGWAALPGKRSAYLSSISHDDAASAVVAVLGAPSGTYNVADDRPLTHAQYLNAIALLLHARKPRFLPGWTAALMGPAGLCLARSIRLSNRRLRDATGWSPSAPSAVDGLSAALIPEREPG